MSSLNQQKLVRDSSFSEINFSDGLKILTVIESPPNSSEHETVEPYIIRDSSDL